MPSMPSHSQMKDEIKEAIRSHAGEGESAALSSPRYESFRDWAEVLEEGRRGGKLWYQAPLDARPRSIRVVKVFKNGKIRIDPLSNQADLFTADEGHLGRFRRRALPLDSRVAPSAGDLVWCNRYPGVVVGPAGSPGSGLIIVRLASGSVVVDPTDALTVQRRE